MTRIFHARQNHRVGDLSFDGDMKTRTQVLAVNGHAKHYRVVKRNGAAWEPSWCVVIEGSGSSAESVAHFYNQDDAEQYSRWRNKTVKA